MSTDTLDLLYQDLNAILQRWCPQTRGLVRFERCTPLLQRSAKELVSSPRLAVEELSPQGADAFERAVRALGEQYLAVADTIQEMRAEAKAGAEPSP
ncbi:MAG TPA: hypothetical protein VG758_24850 [Hyphomicrobiaceae bacterium]|jgi:hypothetical protein|nr:hypothetical protein [Hyphomicrobiaceae bacterium]